jgi:hypothetical protein
MKQTITTLVIAGTILAIFAFKTLENKSVGAIGDVKYSVLPPDKFREENGAGWVLMDNKIPLETSDLNSKHGITELPDARGLFIRGLNLIRSDDKADPFLQENRRQRLVGDYQADCIIKHQHPISTGVTDDNPGSKVRGGIFARNSSSGLSENNEGCVETRPKNIAFYIYVKIND